VSDNVYDKQLADPLGRLCPCDHLAVGWISIGVPKAGFLGAGLYSTSERWFRRRRLEDKFVVRGRIVRQYA
jgi:hypothetical protein